MRNFISFLLLSFMASLISYSQTTSYKNGWENGYKEGYCYQKTGCVTPYVPVYPVPKVGENTYKGGYNKGFLKGQSDNSGNTTGSGDANSQLKPLQNNDYGEVMLDYARRSRRLETEKRLHTRSAFDEYVDKAVIAYDFKQYEKCIDYYESSKNLGWYDSSFEHATAVSYFELWKQTKNSKYKSKVKKLLKLSIKHGNKSAKIDLKNLKGLIKKYEQKNESSVYNGNLIISTQSQINTFTYTEVTGDLRINETFKKGDIKSLIGLNSLVFVGGNLTISGNETLITLKGLDNLTSVSGSLNIMSNDALASLDALKNITSVGSLFIRRNDILASLNGLDNIASVDDDINIGYNQGLISFCAIGQLISNEEVAESKYVIRNNGYNPTYTQIKTNSNGGCKK